MITEPAALAPAGTAIVGSVADGRLPDEAIRQVAAWELRVNG